ncbi:g9095 [Coccomyxa viridis]|uniref:G9095 protein n=1 Tax=Coccomyxa viridis TaxID=1274662 RepID=A0ABP1G210_9CHLO
MHVTPTESLSPAFTAADSIVILANTFVQAGVIIDGARQELMKPDDECVTLLVNGKAIAVMDLMHALVDRIARLCQARCPLEEFEDREVCFSTYSFRCSTYVDLSPLQREISKLRYMGTDTCAFMRGLQHREPWIGPVSVREDDGVRDIYDDQGVGLLEDFLFPIYKLIREMLLRLAHTHLVPPDDLPHF